MLKNQKTSHRTVETVETKWHLVDAAGRNVGRLASQIATVLRGKHRADFSPHLDMGDHVVVINCEKVDLSNKKWQNKVYYWHTNHIGGIKQRTAMEQLEKHSELILELAVKGMLPKTHLGREQLKKLRLFKGDKHDHQAQKPVPLEFAHKC